jgi:hypothetical protein
MTLTPVVTRFELPLKARYSYPSVVSLEKFVSPRCLEVMSKPVEMAKEMWEEVQL